MKPTEQAIKEFAKDYVAWKLRNSGNPQHVNLIGTENAFIAGYEKALSQMQPEWVAVEPRMSPETATRITDTDPKLVQCLFDNGDVIRYDEPFPFAVMTHVCFLPQPPIK